MVPKEHRNSARPSPSLKSTGGRRGGRCPAGRRHAASPDALTAAEKSQHRAGELRCAEGGEVVAGYLHDPRGRQQAGKGRPLMHPGCRGRRSRSAWASGPAAARPSASPRTCRGRSAPLAGRRRSPKSTTPAALARFPPRRPPRGRERSAPAGARPCGRIPGRAHPAPGRRRPRGPAVRRAPAAAAPAARPGSSRQGRSRRARGGRSARARRRRARPAGSRPDRAVARCRRGRAGQGGSPGSPARRAPALARCRPAAAPLPSSPCSSTSGRPAPISRHASSTPSRPGK